MEGSPLRMAHNVMSGNVTARRIAAAEANVTPTRKPKSKKKKPVQQALAFKPQQKHVDARQRAIDEATARDRAAIIEMQKKQSLRSR